MSASEGMKRSSSAPALKAFPVADLNLSDALDVPFPARLQRSQSIDSSNTALMAAVDSVNERFRTDILLRSQCPKSPTPSTWRLSKYSHLLLDRSTLATYNELILHRINSTTPWMLYIFRRLLQTVSIASVSLFVLILLAMYKHSETISISSKMEELPSFGEDLGNLLFDELVLSVLNETDRVIQRYTESHLAVAHELMDAAKLDPELRIEPKHPVCCSMPHHGLKLKNFKV